MRFEKPYKFVLFLLSLCQIFLHSSYGREDVIPGSRYTSARAAALGDAFLPLGEDGGSILFYNPANIGKLLKAQLEPIELGIYGGTGFTSNITVNSYNAYDLSKFSASLQQAPNAFEGFGGSLISSFSSRYFAVGVLAQSQLGGQFLSASNQIRYRSLYQFIPAAATGIRLAEGIVRLGYSIQWVNEAVGDRAAPVGTPTLAYNDQLSQGSGFSHMLGAALTLPMSFLPSINVVCRNFLNTYYTLPSIIAFSPNSIGAPPTEPMSFDLSASIQPKLGAGALLNIVFEWRDFTNASNIVFLGHLSMGMELAVRDIFFVRAGWGSGYPNFGLGLKRKTGELSLTYYSEEISPAYWGQQDARFLLQYRVKAF